MNRRARRAARRSDGERGGFPSAPCHAIYFTIVVLSPPPLRVRAMMRMIRTTAPTRAQSRQSEMNSDDELVVTEEWLVLVDDESCATAGERLSAPRTAARTMCAALPAARPIRFIAAAITSRPSYCCRPGRGTERG